jgi:tetratricopeptide (TPR) repeat protein
MRRGRFDEALREIEKVHDPMFAVTVHLTRSEIYRYRGQYDSALREAQRFHEIWSGSDEPLLQMSLCYIALVEYAKAERLADQISQEHPARDRLLSTIYLLQGRIEESREAAQRLLAQQPEVPFSWWMNGYIAFWERNYEEAVEDFERAYQLKNTDDLNWWRPHATYLAAALWHLDERDRSRHLFSEQLQTDQEAIAAGNLHPGLRKDIAVIYAIQGDIEQALDWMQKAVSTGYSRYDLARHDGLLENLYETTTFQDLMANVESRVEQLRRRVEAMEREWGM